MASSSGVTEWLRLCIAARLGSGSLFCSFDGVFDDRGVPRTAQEMTLWLRDFGEPSEDELSALADNLVALEACTGELLELAVSQVSGHLTLSDLRLSIRTTSLWPLVFIATDGSLTSEPLAWRRWGTFTVVGEHLGS